MAAEGGYRCDYVVTVTNMGKDPHNGQIVVDEQFGFAPSSVVFSPEWQLPESRRGVPLHASACPPRERRERRAQGVGHGPGRQVLQAQEHRHHDGPRGPTRGSMATPATTLRRRRPTSRRRTARSPTGRNASPRPTRSAARAAPASASRVLSATTTALCVGLTEPPVTNRRHRAAVTEPKLCPDGKPVPKTGRCPSTPPQPQCGPNEQRNGKGQCVCLEGFERDQKGRCVEEETPVEEENPEDECEAKGWLWDDKRDRCVPPPTEPEEPAEPSGPTGPIACKPGKNEIRNAQGQCVCKKGYDRDKYGRCVAPTPQCTPGPNEERNAQDQCVCKKGYDRDKNGRCVKPIRPRARMQGQRLGLGRHALPEPGRRLQGERLDVG